MGQKVVLVWGVLLHLTFATIGQADPCPSKLGAVEDGKTQFQVKLDEMLARIPATEKDVAEQKFVARFHAPRAAEKVVDFKLEQFGVIPMRVEPINEETLEVDVEGTLPGLLRATSEFALPIVEFPYDLNFEAQLYRRHTVQLGAGIFRRFDESTRRQLLLSQLTDPLTVTFEFNSRDAFKKAKALLSVAQEEVRTALKTEVKRLQKKQARVTISERMIAAAHPNQGLLRGVDLLGLEILGAYHPFRENKVPRYIIRLKTDVKSFLRLAKVLDYTKVAQPSLGRRFLLRLQSEINLRR